MQFKFLSRHAIRLSALVFALGLAACGNNTQGKEKKPEPSIPTNSELPDNVLGTGNEILENNFGYDYEPVSVCEYENQNCLIDSPTNNGLGCVNTEDPAAEQGVCTKLCGGTFYACDGNKQRCVPWKSQSSLEPVYVNYEGYCSTEAGECSGIFDTTSCGANKVCRPSSKYRKTFVCVDAPGTKKEGDTCKKGSTNECGDNTVCAENFFGDYVCSKLCQDASQLEGLSKEEQTARGCIASQFCQGVDSAGIIELGVGLCFEKPKKCNPNKSLSCTTSTGQHGLCLKTKDGYGCISFDGAGNKSIGTGTAFEICDDSKPCAEGLTCQQINEDGNRYCVQPCDTKQEPNSCGHFGATKPALGTGAEYHCVEGLRNDNGYYQETGYCLLTCANDQVGEHCNSATDTSLPNDNVSCVISEYNLGTLGISSGPICLGRNPTPVAKGDPCDGSTTVCQAASNAPPLTCAFNEKATPTPRDECTEHIVCHNDSDCTGGQICNMKAYTKGPLGLCETPCKPDAQFVDLQCPVDKQSCVQIGVNVDGDQFTYCSDSSGTIEAGQACSIKVALPFGKRMALAPFPVQEPCKSPTTCVTNADMGTLKGFEDFNDGVCRNRCKLTMPPTDSTSVCGKDQACSPSNAYYYNKSYSNVGVSQLTDLCMPKAKLLNPSKGTEGGECDVNDTGKPCWNGSRCLQVSDKKAICLDLCKKDSDCTKGSKSEPKCNTSASFFGEYGYCENFDL